MEEKAAPNGRPAFFPLSLKIGKSPVAAWTTNSQAVKTTAGTIQVTSLTPKRSRRRMNWTIRAMPRAAGTTRTVSRVRAP